jgi:hypothetical protein
MHNVSCLFERCIYKSSSFAYKDVMPKAFGALKDAMPKISVLDSHIHLAVGWQDGSGLSNSWLKNEPTSFHRDWTEKDVRSFGSSCPPTWFCVLPFIT